MQIIYLRNPLFLFAAISFAAIAIADEATDVSKLQPLRERVLTQAEQQEAQRKAAAVVGKTTGNA